MLKFNVSFKKTISHSVGLIPNFRVEGVSKQVNQEANIY
jgi:hypothetical protein